MTLTFNTLDNHIDTGWLLSSTSLKELGYNTTYFQIHNYLKHLKCPIKLSNSLGIVELSFFRKPDKTINNWYNNLNLDQKKLIKENPLLISFCHEFWDCQFNVIENFCDSINKKYEDVAVVVSNFDKLLSSKIKIIDASKGFLKWMSRLWFETSINDQKYPFKKYTCLNGRPAKHRLEVINFLGKYNLINDGLVSFGIGKSIGVTFNGCYEFDGPIDSHTVKNMMLDWNIKDNYIEKYLPLIVDNDFKQSQVNWSKFVDIELITESFSNIESTYNEPKHGPFTEKTLRPIYNSQPFLVLCTDQTATYEKELGYYIFDDLHDNTPESIVLALKDLINSNIDLKNYKQKEVRNNKELFMYHSSHDISNIYTQIKEWIN